MNVPNGLTSDAQRRKIIARTTVSVRFSDVDCYNIVHNAKYFDYFDAGRFQILQAFFRRDLPYERGEHYFLVLKASIKYVGYARFGDQLIVETRWQFDPSLTNAQINLEHAVLNKADSKVIAEGASVLGVCDHDYKLIYFLPPAVRQHVAEKLEYFRVNKSDELVVH